MADTNAIYIASISGGKCIENTQQERGELRLRAWNKGATQQWLVEASENDPNTVAFKSVSNRQYLVALEPNKRNGGKLGVSPEKQWWTLEPGRGPQWFHVRSNSVFSGGKAGYLNDEWGRIRNDNKLQTYQYEEGNPGFNTFYFSSAAASDSQTFHLAGDSTAADDQAKKKAELDDKEKKLQEREAAAEKDKQANETKTKELEQKQADLVKQQEDLAQKEKDNKAEAASKDAEKTKALEEKEAALAKREDELARKERDSQAKGAPKPDGSAERTKALEQREAAATKKEEELQRREKDLASQPASALATEENERHAPSEDHRAGPTPQPNGVAKSHVQESESGDPHELCRLLRENDVLNLKVKVGDLEAKLRERPTCTHKVRRPPRKIDRKVAGYVYV